MEVVLVSADLGYDAVTGRYLIANVEIANPNEDNLTLGSYLFTAMHPKSPYVALAKLSTRISIFLTTIGPKTYSTAVIRWILCRNLKQLETTSVVHAFQVGKSHLLVYSSSKGSDPKSSTMINRSLAVNQHHQHCCVHPFAISIG